MQKSWKMIASMAFASVLALAMLAGCGQDANGKAASSSSEAASTSAAADAEAVSLKDNPEEAEYQIQVAMQYLLEDAYGDKVNDARIQVKKIYTAEEEQADELLKTYNLGPDEVAFEVEYKLHPADGVDPNELTAATGRYDEETGWVVDKFNVGILRLNPDGDEPAFVITDFGTAF